MSLFKYAHLADLHLGSWPEEKIRDLSTRTFLAAIDDCMQRQVDFILFAGDLFNTSLPSVDTLKIVTKKLKELKDADIPLYVIAGSHDFSPSGKTMIDVLENAGLLKNVCKGNVDATTQLLHLQFTEDAKTGAKITGILGRKGQLDTTYYQNLSRENLEKEDGYKIFMFHTSITELKPKHLEYVESQPVTFLPKRFQYYAGGHLHHKTLVEIPDYGTLTYPGALFPNNFAELEKYGHGGYFVISVGGSEDADGQFRQQVEWMPVKLTEHLALTIDCQHKTPEVVMFEMQNQINNMNLTNTIVTLRLHGTLESGRVSDIHFKEIMNQMMKQGAYAVLRNTAQLSSEEFAEIKIAPGTPEEMEERIINEHLQQSSVFEKERERELISSLLQVLNTTKKEGETAADFQERVEQEVGKVMG